MLKLQYIADIGADKDNFPFQNQYQVLSRIKVIYSTARQGKITNNVAINLRDYFFIVSQSYNEIPNTVNGYNDYAKKKIRKVAEIISQNNNLKFGMAQKFFNLFMKDLWAWNKLTPEQERVLHFPLDRIILTYMRYNPWKAWTKIIAPVDEYNNKFKQYLGIQNIFRNQLRYYNFNSPLELEQYLWHRFQ